MAKKKTTKNVNVDAVKREVKKLKGSYSSVPDRPGFGSNGTGEAAPGTVRRESPLEQDMGSSKYRDMIHGHNDKNKHILDRLPFTFPKKKVVRSHLSVTLVCPECGNETTGSENTVGFICTKCHKYVSAKNLEAESRGYDPDFKVGIFGTASDRLRLKKEKEEKDSQ